jgi:transcriptional regulator with XRE-family HTH domain
MTPFGAKIRELRLARGITLKAMAAALQVSPAYLSALEHGHRGMPTWTLVQRVIVFFNVIWDEADELERLAQISNPRIVVDTGGLTPRATEFANRLAKQIGSLEEADLERLLTLLPGDPRAAV